MKELIEFLARSLVENPDQVRVTEREEEDTIVYELNVAQEDMGKVIGKQGKIAKAIRTIARAASSKDGKKVLIQIV